MFRYICKQTLRKLYGYMTREFLGFRMQNFQSTIFIWIRTYREIFKSALVYLWTSAKPLRIRFDKIDGFIKIYNGIRCLILFDYSYCDEICDEIQYLISEKVVLQILLSINRNISRIRTDLCDSLPIEKILTFHDVMW